MKNKLFKRADLLLLFLVLLLAGGFFVLRGSGEGTIQAYIYESGRLVRQIDLETLEAAETISCAAGSVTLRAERGTICFQSSDCSSQTCVQTGTLRNAGDTAVCVPNQVTVTLRSEKEQHYQTY